MFARTHAFAVVFGMVSLLAPAPAPAQEKDAPADAFAGKYLVVITRSDPEYWYSLEKVRIRQMGGAQFLVGTGADDGSGDWAIGRATWIAMRDVSVIIEFSSLKELEDAMQAPAEDRTAGSATVRQRLGAARSPVAVIGRSSRTREAVRPVRTGKTRRIRSAF